MLKKYARENNNHYNCEDCDYTTHKKSSWTQHIKSKKHRNANNANEKYAPNNYISINTSNTIEMTCIQCNKLYKHQSSLSRHKKMCPSRDNIVLSKREYDMILKNTELKGELNSIKNNINIQVHLQEKFPTAINFSQLIHDIPISMKDLEYTSEYGYVEWVSNIILQAVEKCKETYRPIHHILNHPDKSQVGCYIKEQGTWSKDIDGCIFNKGIVNLTHKQFVSLKNWEVDNPKWIQTDTGQQQYNNLVYQIVSNLTQTDLKIQKCVYDRLSL
jgi:hypothetical protein